MGRLCQNFMIFGKNRYSIVAQKYDNYHIFDMIFVGQSDYCIFDRKHGHTIMKQLYIILKTTKLLRIGTIK